MASPRVKMIALVHIAKKDLAVEDDSYRELLKRVTGLESTKSMTDRQLSAVIDEFKRLGWKKKKPKKAGDRRQAQGDQARKIRALWLNLKEMGELRDTSEAALAAFVSRATGVDDLAFLTPQLANVAINALRGWIKRIEKQRAQAKE